MPTERRKSADGSWATALIIWFVGFALILDVCWIGYLLDQGRTVPDGMMMLANTIAAGLIGVLGMLFGQQQRSNLPIPSSSTVTTQNIENVESMAPGGTVEAPAVPPAEENP